MVGDGLRVLGIDPGSRATGFAVIESRGQASRCLEHGVIRVPGKEPLHERLGRLHGAVVELVERHRPAEVAIEEVFTARNARSALVLGHARGVLLLAAATGDAGIFEYNTRTVKKAVAGYGQAGKQQVAQMVTKLLGLKEVPAQDAADALAIALCHVHSRAIRTRVDRLAALEEASR